ncbi:hypothetical protein J2W88_001607 [Acidovorax delafieldii]|uniref:Uncharacterized protein n=1 Tax=Acidovorax delafieldii TaxID=47920 RepID=A0AAJ2BQ41_ACIDE|nr:hypothetical protein [Acidovorax delafieldii]MDR6766342.1 hypothetical protein [Acidovorax delafieldii]MDR6836720.1 hypothetical protein [Acidovorax delafieldii]MDR7366211.1 hypothetical protein [Acidovorax delafieldii]
MTPRCRSRASRPLDDLPPGKAPARSAAHH